MYLSDGMSNGKRHKMITTTSGTPVELVTPIDPITGWVTIEAYLGDNGTVIKRIDNLDLIADGGYDELQAASNNILATMSKRIFKYLINRDDTMYFKTPEHTIYVDNHNDDNGDTFFYMYAFTNGRDECGDYGQRVESRIINDVKELERQMKEIGDLRKWRVSRNSLS